MFNPCCCGPACIVFQDDFNRADDTDLGANWTEESGSWEIVSNELNTTSSNAQVTHSVSSAENYWTTVNVKGQSNGDQLRMVMVDGSYKSIIELEVGTTAKLRLYDDIGSGEHLRRECDVTAAANSWHKIENRLNSVFLNDVLIFTSVFTWSDTSTATEYGLATASISANAYFEEFVLTKYKHDSVNEQCELCDSCVFPPVCDRPESITVVIDGLGDNGVADYSVFNGTYFLDWVSGCTYKLTGLSISFGGVIVDELYFDNSVGGTGGATDDAIFMQFQSTTGTPTVPLPDFQLWTDPAFDGPTSICGDVVVVNSNNPPFTAGTATVSY